MSFKFINDFQAQIYRVLSSDKNISSSVNKIYLGAVQDGKCPFLLINIKKVEELFQHVEQIYSIEFQISIYAKDQHHKLLVSLADKIVSALGKSEILFEGFKVSGMKANQVTFEKAKDLVINRLIVDYKSLIRKDIL